MFVLFYSVLINCPASGKYAEAAVEATQTDEPIAQMAMAGMEIPSSSPSSVRCCDLTAGSAVKYLGSVQGGPRHGSRGTIRQPLARRAVVDMGRVGTWHIPYYLLATLEKK